MMSCYDRDTGGQVLMFQPAGRKPMNSIETYNASLLEYEEHRRRMRLGAKIALAVCIPVWLGVLLLVLL